MHVHGVLQLLRQGLHLGLLLQRPALRVEELALHVIHLPAAVVRAQLALQVLDRQPQHPHVLQPLGVLRLARAQRRHVDLELLVQQRQLVVAADELRAHDVALVDHLVVLLALRGHLVVHPPDHGGQALDLRPASDHLLDCLQQQQAFMVLKGFDFLVILGSILFLVDLGLY